MVPSVTLCFSQAWESEECRSNGSPGDAKVLRVATAKLPAYYGCSTIPKMPTLSVRLDAETASLVDSIARRTGSSKSEVVRAAINDYARTAERSSGLSFYDKIKDFVGRWDSGDTQLSTRSGKEIAEMLREERQRGDIGRRRATRRAG